MFTNFNIETLIEQDNSFVRANSVGSGPPIHKLVTSCLEWEQKGVPFVVRGVPLDKSSERPFEDPTPWLKMLSGAGGYFSRNSSEADFKTLFQDHQSTAPMTQIALIWGLHKVIAVFPGTNSTDLG